MKLIQLSFSVNHYNISQKTCFHLITFDCSPSNKGRRGYLDSNTMHFILFAGKCNRFSCSQYQTRFYQISMVFIFKVQYYISSLDLTSAFQTWRRLPSTSHNPLSHIFPFWEDLVVQLESSILQYKRLFAQLTERLFRLSLIQRRRLLDSFCVRKCVLIAMDTTYLVFYWKIRLISFIFSSHFLDRNVGCDV